MSVCLINLDNVLFEVLQVLPGLVVPAVAREVLLVFTQKGRSRPNRPHLHPQQFGHSVALRLRSSQTQFLERRYVLHWSIHETLL